MINNQIGFTTDPVDARSTRYCTDVAKMIEAPIFHVNGDDPEAVCMVAQLALEFREKFHRDVFIDMYCFRRRGHNETDEPAFTQPILYKKIAAHPLVSAVYTDRLVAASTITSAEGEAITAEYSASLEENLTKAKAREAAKIAKRAKAKPTDAFKGSTAIFQPVYHHTPVETGVSRDVLDRVVLGLTTVPPTFKTNPKIQRFLEARTAAYRDGGPIDWGFGEALAFGSCSPKTRRSVSAAKTASAARSLTGTPSSTTPKPPQNTRRSKTFPAPPPGSAFTTPCCLKSPCSVSITATRSTTPRCSASGKPNSATLPTAPRS